MKKTAGNSAELKNYILSFLNKGAEQVAFINITRLPYKYNRGYRTAILFCKKLSASYLKQITHLPEYVDLMIRTGKIKNDEFTETEISTDSLADDLAEYLVEKGFSTESQSEERLDQSGKYNHGSKSTPLPHKTIARLAGWGWIGRHNLLVTHKFGSAISMCSVLTDASVETDRCEAVSQNCNTCYICKKVCTAGAILGNDWDINQPREHLIDVSKCTTCLKCMVFCPYTQQYMRRNLED